MPLHLTASPKLVDSEAVLAPRIPRGPCHRVSVHVQLLWTTLSVVVTAGCSFSFIQPFWFVQRHSKDCLGLYNYCVRDQRPGGTIFSTSRGSALGVGGILGGSGGVVEGAGALIGSKGQVCGAYGGQFNLSNLPSNSWQVACVLFGGGCCLLGCAALVALLSLCLPRSWAHRVACSTGYLQTMAAAILVVAVVLFPVGLDSKFAQHYCPGARTYQSGACHVGWAYILGVMSTALSLFCPFLAQYTDFNDEDDDVDDVTTSVSTSRLVHQ